MNENQVENSLTFVENEFSITHTTITYNENNYRVGIHQLNSYRSVLLFWTVICSCLCGVSLAVILEDLLQTKGIIVCSMLVMSSLILFILSIKKRQFLGRLFILSSLSMSILFTFWLIIFALEEKALTIPTSSIILIQLVLSFIWLKNKGMIFLKGLVVCQILLIAMKLDSIVQCKWIPALFILIVISLFILSSAIFVAIFAIISLIMVPNLPSQKKCGFAFIGNVCLCLGMNTIIPFYQFIFKINFWIGGAVALVANCLTILFILKYHSGIIVFFCRTQEVKTFDQNIFITEINQESLKKYRLQQLSENWYRKVKKSRKLNKNKENISDRKNIKESHCLVCLENPPEVVWVPCGHLTVCMKCCSRMFKKKNATCILCKMIPTQVYVIEVQRRQKEHESTKEIIETNQEEIPKYTQIFALKLGYRIRIH